MSNSMPGPQAAHLNGPTLSSTVPRPPRLPVAQVQVAHGGVKVSRGLFKFGTTDGLHQALARTRDQLPWLRRGHQAHINSGDVASRCVHVNSVDCKLAFENLPYFSMT